MIEKKAKFKNSLNLNIPKQSKVMEEGVDLHQDSYTNIKLLGKGSFGEVYLIMHKKEKKNMALKLIVAKSLEKEYIDKLVQEVIIHYSCQDKNVVHCYGYRLEDFVLKIALEYMDFGNLKDIFDYKKVLHENLLGYIAYNVLKGLYGLEQKKILHRDIKPSNLLMNLKGEVKISDFGESGTLKEICSYRNTLVGTLLYNSPERIIGDKYYVNCDVWSLGLIMMEGAIGKNPLLISQNTQDKLDFINLEQTVRNFEFPDIPEGYSSKFKNFVNQCLIKDPRKRPYSSTLLHHEFIKQYEKIKQQKMALVLKNIKDTKKQYEQLEKLKQNDK